MEASALSASVRERFTALATKLEIHGDADALWALLEGCAPFVGADSLGPPEVRCRIMLTWAVVRGELHSGQADMTHVMGHLAPLRALRMRPNVIADRERHVCVRVLHLPVARSVSRQNGKGPKSHARRPLGRLGRHVSPCPCCVLTYLPGAGPGASPRAGAPSLRIRPWGPADCAVAPLAAQPGRGSPGSYTAPAPLRGAAPRRGWGGRQCRMREAPMISTTPPRVADARTCCSQSRGLSEGAAHFSSERRAFPDDQVWS